MSKNSLGFSLVAANTASSIPDNLNCGHEGDEEDESDKEEEDDDGQDDDEDEKDADLHLRHYLPPRNSLYPSSHLNKVDKR